MASFHQLTYHIIFSTKYRHPWINAEIEPRLYDYMGGIVKSVKGSLILIGGVADHVHLLAGLSPTISVSDAIRNIKGGSSRWLTELGSDFSKFSWQKGYGAFTVSYSNIPSVSEYIANQKEHHRKKTFTEEYIEFLKRHNLAFFMDRLFEDEHHG